MKADHCSTLALQALVVATDRNYRRDREGMGDDIVDLLAHVRHLCDQHDFDFGVLNDRAYTTYLWDKQADSNGDLNEAPVLPMLEFDVAVDGAFVDATHYFPASAIVAAVEKKRAHPDQLVTVVISAAP